MSSRSFRTAGLLALLLAAALPAAAHAQRDDATSVRSRIDTTFAFERDGLVDIGQVSGDIEVTTWDRAEVRIRAHAQYGRLESSFSPSRAWLRVEGEEDGRDNRRNRRIGDSRYEVTVPAGARVKASSVSGNVRVGGTRAEVDAASTSGNVTVSETEGMTTVSTVSGDVSVTRVQGDLSVKTVSGDLVAREVRGEVRAGTVSGDVTLRAVTGRGVSARSTSGDVSFDGAFDAGGRYEFVSHSGDVVLGLADDVGAEMAVQTFSGDLNTAFPVTLGAGARRATRTRTLEFTLGGGGARVRVETFSGDVVLRRAGAERR